MPTPLQGTGIGLTFVTSAVELLIVDLRRSGVMRGDVETTHSETAQTGGITWKTFVPSELADPGGLEADTHFDPSIAVPFNALETLQIGFPANPFTVPAQTAGAVIAFDGYVNAQDDSYQPLADETMRATVRIKASGPFTITPPTTA